MSYAGVESEVEHLQHTGVIHTDKEPRHCGETAEHGLHSWPYHPALYICTGNRGPQHTAGTHRRDGNA
jgi:hypothetical protein